MSNAYVPPLPSHEKKKIHQIVNVIPVIATHVHVIVLGYYIKVM